jgi:hypothetical protein
MDWKKSIFYFTYQAFKHANNIKDIQTSFKFYANWMQSFGAGRNSVADELPWLNLPAIRYLRDNITPAFKIYEYGGGGSTLFFCARAAEVVTVEDHQAWFATLTQTIQSKSYTNWKGRFISPEIVDGDQNRSHENPADFKSGAKGLEHLSFKKYAKSIHDFPMDYFDLVLVDGRARPSCIQEAMPHLKSGGLLVVDNTERPYYLAPFRSILAIEYEKVLEVRAPVYYTPDFTITSIYRKR